MRVTYEINVMLAKVGKCPSERGEPVQRVLALDGLPQLPANEVAPGKIATMPRF
jgi:hypothetical protein